MLTISDENPKMIEFGKALDRNKKKYSHNTKRLYRWQGKRLLLVIQKVRADDLNRTAELYLRRLRAKHSRTYFLQACSATKIMLEEVYNRPLREDILRKLQSA